ncbi:DUF1992 domain-containing protein [Bacillus sp. 1P06AnD]|uniref:DUF1992 domain-containing protein n=1 Tax=Bacillus sp. 1P06AnD TaxID=3132208 RepID=UPI0039A0ACB5
MKENKENAISYRRDGEEIDLKNNPGFGKPLPKNMFKGNVFQSFQNTARDAGYLPAWVEKRKLILGKLEYLIVEMEKNMPHDEASSILAGINQEVKQYNTICPVQMQRAPLEMDRLMFQCEAWK